MNLDNRADKAILFDLKSKLREALMHAMHANGYQRIRTPASMALQPTPHSLNVILTRRSMGKTSALVEFVAERILSLDPDALVGVVCLSRDACLLFLDQFQREFPTLKVPMVVVAEKPHTLCSCKVVEMYIDEVFFVSPSDLRHWCAHYPVIAGLGTIEQPTTLTLSI